MAPDDTQEIIHDSAEEAILLDDLFAALSNNSTFVAVYLFLEHQLIYIRDQMRKLFKTEFSVRDLQGTGIGSYKTYLKKLCNIDIPQLGTQWQEIQQLQRVRNVIVHRLGELEDEGSNGKKARDDDVHAYLKARADASNQYNKVVLPHEFCLHSIEVVREFLAHIVIAVPHDLADDARQETK